MMALHPLLSEPITVEVKTKDRGRMLLDLEDSAQFPLYYNIYEWKDKPTLEKLVQGTRTVVDIGGNIGQMALLFAQYAKRVITFEPIPRLADRLEEQIKLNALDGIILLRREALSDHEGTLQIELPTIENGGSGSTILTHAISSTSIEVKAKRLDTVLNEIGIGDVDFVKMDIEGAELFALRGMTELLREPHGPIMVLEMNQKMMDLAGYSASDIIKFLGRFDYRCYRFMKSGLEGPLSVVQPHIENYCFLTSEHIARPHIHNLLI